MNTNKYFHCYAVKVIDENGYITGYMNIITSGKYKSGDIIEDCFGQRLKIDFKRAKQ